MAKLKTIVAPDAKNDNEKELRSQLLEKLDEVEVG